MRELWLLLSAAILCAGVAPARARAQLSSTPAGELGIYFDQNARESIYPAPPASPLSSGSQFRVFVLATFKDSPAPPGQSLWGWEGHVDLGPGIIVLRRDVVGTNFAAGGTADDFCVGLGATPLDPSRGTPLLLATYECLLLGNGVVNASMDLSATTTCGSPDATGPQWLTYPGNEIVPFATTSLALVNPQLETFGSIKRNYQEQ